MTIPRRLADANLAPQSSLNALPCRLKTGDAARYCGCSKSLLEKLRLKGLAPPYIKLSPRFVVYDTADLDAWLASGRSDGDAL